MADCKDRLSVVPAACFCGCSPSMLNRLRVTGGGPRYLKLGRRVVYDTSDLRAWLESHRQFSTSQTPPDREAR